MITKPPAVYGRLQNILHLTEPLIVANPYPFYKNLARHGPLYWDQETRLWVCTGYGEAETILCDLWVHFGVSRFRSTEQLQARGLQKCIPAYTLLRPHMIAQDDPHHSQVRTAISRSFHKAPASAFQEALRCLIDDQLAQWAHSQRDGLMDLIDDFAGPLPTKASALFLGLPLSDLPFFLRWSAAYDDALASFTGPAQLRLQTPQYGLLEALEEASQYFQHIVRARLGHLQDDPISDMVRSLIGSGTTAVPDTAIAIIAAYSMLLLIGGYATATNLIVQALLWLSKKPDQHRLFDENQALLDDLIDETTRLSSSCHYVTRQALQDTIIGSKRIRRGQTVVVLLAAAHRDEHAFPSASEFFLGRRDPKKLLGRGLSRHALIGAPYADLLARVAIQTFLQRFPDFHMIDPKEIREWKGPPNARCPLHVSVSLGAQHAGSMVPDLLAPALTPPQRKEGASYWQNEVVTVSPCGEGAILRFDPRQIKLSFDLQRGVIIAYKESGSVESTLPLPTTHTDRLTYEAPGPEDTKRCLQELFAIALAIPSGWADENCDFFEAGGDSLALTSLCLSIEQRLQVALDPVEIYEYPKLVDLAGRIGHQRRVTDPEQEAVYS
ncbi:MAG: cytochrome P450 [Ktedonobacteraceae bacterium]